MGKKQQKKKIKRNGNHATILPGMDFLTSQRFFQQTKEAVTDHAKGTHEKVLRDRQAQRMSWLWQVALNELYGFGSERIGKAEARVQALSGEYNRMVAESGQDYADEKLRESVSKVRKKQVQYLYNDMFPINSERPEGGEEAACAALGEAENRIY